MSSFLGGIPGLLFDSALGLPGKIIEKVGEDILKQGIKDAAHQFKEDELPSNHDLEKALSRSLGRTARFLAYWLHDPTRKSLCDVLANCDLGNFFHRIAEGFQGNILEESPQDYWLSELITKTRVKDAFRSIELRILTSSPSRLTREHFDQEFAEFINREFLDWVKEHVTTNPNRPKNFDTYVQNGWRIPPDTGRTVTFYGIFCLFFREEVKSNERVIRAFTVRVLSDLDEKIDRLTKAVDSPTDPKLLAALKHARAGLNESQLTQILKTHLDSQNQQLLGAMLEGFAGLHKRHDRHDAAHASQGSQLVDIKAGVELLVEAQKLAQPTLKSKPAAWPTDDPVWDRVDNAYRQHVIERFGKLTLYSLSSDQPIAVDLEQVFVKLTAVESHDRFYSLLKSEIQELTVRKERAIEGQDFEKSVAYRVKEKSAKQRLSSLTEASAASDRQVRGFRFPPKALTEVPLSLPDALRAHSHLAIIGAPGAGKTTALKWLALAYARKQVKERLEFDELLLEEEENRLPLFVALRDFNRFLDCLEKSEGLPSPLPPALLARHLQAYYAEHVKSLPLPTDFFLRALVSGRALVLLDGLDEVAESSKRVRAAEFVAACVQQYSGCRFVLTSRPRGYESDCRSHLAAHCSECRVRDFDDDDITAFAKNWYLAVTIAREGDNPTTRDKAEGEARKLQAAVKQERVRPLAASPLLLSILALIHQKGVGLPQRRVELYQECTEFLLGYWDQTKLGEAARELSTLGNLEREEKLALLEPIALWIHERGEKGTEVSRKELEAQLAEQFCARYGDDPAKANARSREFVAIIEQRAGLIVEREQDTFAFTHLTFQEYLAARALSDREDFVDQTLRHLHDPWWREVHLLEVAHLSSQNARIYRVQTEQLLAAIRAAGSWLENELHRDLLFAFHALCDVGPIGVDNPFREVLTHSVLELWSNTHCEPLRERIEARFIYGSPTPVGTLILTKLFALTKEMPVDDCARAVSALGHLGSAAATPEVVAQLMDLIENGKSNVRDSAAFALGRMGSAAVKPDVLARLVTWSHNANPSVRARAAFALGGLGSTAATPEVLSRLLILIWDDDHEVRVGATYALGGLGSAAATPEVLTQLLVLIRDEDGEVRAGASSALGQMGSAAATPEVLDRLVALIRHGNDAVRARAAKALSGLGSAAATPAVLAQLVALIDGANSYVRLLAIESWGAIVDAAATPEVVAQLMDLIENGKSNVRDSAAFALGRMGSAAVKPDVLARLVTWSHNANPSVRARAAFALGGLGSTAATPEVLSRLVALSQEADDAVCCHAAEALGSLGNAAATPEVLARLVELSQEDHAAVRSCAAAALGSLGGAAATSEVLAQLVALVREGKDGVRTLAAVALGQMVEELAPERAKWLAAWWSKHLANKEFIQAEGSRQRYMDAAFDILHRLAARMPRTAGAEGKRIKAKGKTGSRAAKAKRTRSAV